MWPGYVVKMLLLKRPFLYNIWILFYIKLQSYVNGHPLDNNPQSYKFYIDIAMIFFVVLFCGLLSGLTLAYLTFDSMSLAILKSSGTLTERKYATSIESLLVDRHLLLVTLLLSNSIAAESLPLFLDRVVGTVVAIILSVTLVLMFGEIVPQAVMKRYQLPFAGRFSIFMKVLIAILYIIAKPIALILDYVLGTDHDHKYRPAELKELIDFHSESNLGSLTIDEVTMIKGVLDMKTKTAEICMMPFEKVFVLPVTATLNRRTMQLINDSGHSRIPVYDGDRENILGMLLVKNLITLDPNDSVPISSLRLRKILDISNNYALFDLLNDFQLGGSHMAIVRGVSGNIIGIITLEDIIEELIQEEIEDEMDNASEKFHIVQDLVQIKKSKTSLLSLPLKIQSNLPLNSHLRCQSSLDGASYSKLSTADLRERSASSSAWLGRSCSLEESDRASDGSILSSEMTELIKFKPVKPSFDFLVGD